MKTWTSSDTLFSAKTWNTKQRWEIFFLLDFLKFFAQKFFRKWKAIEEPQPILNKNTQRNQLCPNHHKHENDLQAKIFRLNFITKNYFILFSKFSPRDPSENLEKRLKKDHNVEKMKIKKMNNENLIKIHRFKNTFVNKKICSRLCKKQK